MQADHNAPNARMECQRPVLLIRSTPVLAMSFLVQGGDFISCLERIDHEIPELAHIHSLHIQYAHVASAQSFSY